MIAAEDIVPYGRQAYLTDTIDTEEEQLHMLALSLVKNVGPVLGKTLIAHFGSAKRVLNAKLRHLLKVQGIGPHLAEALLSKGVLQRAEKELENTRKNHIKIAIWGEENYPDNLREVYDSPLILFYKGKGNLLKSPAIGIVGTRTPSEYGKEIAREFGRFFSIHDVNVVSGLAYGIDAEVHDEVLRNDGQTTAVLGHGLDLIYPGKHTSKAMKIMEMGNLVSEYPVGTGPDACNFPARNRIISGMCQAVVVIEAAESGGALITARVGFDQNREIFAVPGDIHRRTSMGCNRLIRDNIAKLVTSPEEVLQELNLILDKKQFASNQCLYSRIQDRQEAQYHSLKPEERILMETLEILEGKATASSLCDQSGLGLGNVQLLVLGLEFKGLLKQIPGGFVQRV